MGDFKYCYILDYSDATICEILIPNTDLEKEDIQDIIEAHGININCCSFMITENKIENIITLN